MAIAPLQIVRPEEYANGRVDFTPLSEIGNAVARSNRDKKIEGIAAQSRGPDGKLDLGQFSANLASNGELDAARTLATIAHANSTTDLAQKQFANTQYVQSPGYIRSVAETQAQVANQYAPKTTNIKMPDGTEATVEKGPNGYRLIPVQGMDPNQGGAPAPPGVNVQAYRKKLGQVAATNEEDTFKSAKAAAEFKPFIDQAVSAYEGAAGKGGIGPIVGNPIARSVNQYTLGTDAEKARQNYDQALSNVQLRITAAQNKGEGAVSNFERQMYSKQFPDLQALDPQQKLQYLKQIQSITDQAISAGQSSPLATGQIGERALTRESVFPGAKPAKPTFNKELVQAVRANPQGAIAEAQAAIAKGADKTAVINRLRQIGVDTSGL